MAESQHPREAQWPLQWSIEGFSCCTTCSILCLDKLGDVALFHPVAVHLLAAEQTLNNALDSFLDKGARPSSRASVQGAAKAFRIRLCA